MLIWLGFLIFYGYAGLTRLIDWKTFAFIEIIRLVAFGAIFASQYDFTDAILVQIAANTAVYATTFGLFYWIGGRRKRAA